MNTHPTRREFLAASGAAVAASALARLARAQEEAARPGDAGTRPVAIASANGLRTVERARDLVATGADPTVAAVEGVGIVEADPDDMTVGLGGLPNEHGVVQLDAAAMHGPTHKAGAVACIEDILHPAQVALRVLQQTDHVLIVGAGAKRFALAQGFPEQDLLTDKARETWLDWKRNLNPDDDWLDDDQRDWDPAGKTPAVRTTGTIHCSVIAPTGDVGCTTTTSGLSYKIPGRVGDSPIIGAGLYCDNEVGSAGATGRGEAVIQSCGAFSVVQHMAAGKSPTEACLAVLDAIATRSKRQRRLVDDQGRPRFDVKLYAANRDGAYGGASIWSGGRFAVADGRGARIEDAAFLFERAE